MKVDKRRLHELIDKKRLGENMDQLIYQEYHMLVYRIAFSIVKNKETAEDIMQNVFTKLVVISKEQLPKQNETTWLYTVTKNEAIAFLRKYKKEIQIEEIYEMVYEDSQIEDIIHQETYQKIIQGLTKQEQEIISLKVLSDFSFREIAGLLNMPIGTVQWKYYKIMKTLKIVLGNMMICILSLFGYGIYQQQKIKNIKIENENIEKENIEDSSHKERETQDQENMDQETILENKTENTITEETQQIIVDPPISTHGMVDIILLSISAISLICTITFSIIYLKRQQNTKRKSSKQ